jgi:hypothetical protein
MLDEVFGDSPTRIEGGSGPLRPGLQRRRQLEGAGIARAEREKRLAIRFAHPPGRLRGVRSWVGSLLGGLDGEVFGRRVLIYRFNHGA